MWRAPGTIAVTVLSRFAGMTPSPKPSLPHHGLHAYQVAVQLFLAVRGAAIADTSLRTQALRSAKSVCLNSAEAAGRVGADDRKRVFAIARGELSEVAAAVEMAALCGDVDAERAATVVALASRVGAILRGLLR